MTRKFVRLNSTLFFKVEFTFTINLFSCVEEKVLYFYNEYDSIVLLMYKEKEVRQ